MKKELQQGSPKYKHGGIPINRVFEGYLSVTKAPNLLVALDKLTASTIPTCEISSLNHEIFDDTMEFAAFVCEGLAIITSLGEGKKINIGR